MKIKGNKKTQEILDKTIKYLTKASEEDAIGTLHTETELTMPSLNSLKKIVELLRAVLFPGYYEMQPTNLYKMSYHIGVYVEQIHQLLTEQIMSGFCITEKENCNMKEIFEQSENIATKFISRLPELRETLTTDVIAAYNGDPAAKGYSEIIFCYPVLKALVNYRAAHELLMLGVPLIPRIMTELAHSETGIDIHPGATIGKYFTIDHGTGVVIGETSIIGDNVKLYQGVTLGAKSFPLDHDGNPIKGIARHPILENDVIVYSNASILGRVTIGKGSVIGGNVWIIDDVPAGSRVFHNAKDSVKDTNK